MKKFFVHQRTIFQYAMKEPHPAIFVEMRLGKTLVALRRSALYYPRNTQLGVRMLTAAPSSALDSWRKDAEEDGWSVVDLTGEKSRRRKALLDFYAKTEKRTLFTINKEGWIALPEISMVPWDVVVADESPFLKNPRAKVTKFFCKHFRDVPHRWILTGTPCPEGEDEYFCQFQFLRGGAFGFSKYWDFRMHYMRPMPWGGWELKPGAADHIRRVVGDASIVMRRKDVHLDKKKIYERRSLEFPPQIRKIYDGIENDFRQTMTDGSVTSTIWATGKYIWLRQLCGGIQNGKMIWDGKLKELTDLLQGELRKDQVVVWCLFNDEIQLIHQELNRMRIPASGWNGNVKFEKRKSIKHAFDKGIYRVLVLQQATAQVGMDLSVADTAIYYSSPPGQLARLQTEDRILSLRKKTPLLYIDLTVSDSVDEDILESLSGKIQRSDLSLSRALLAAMRKRGVRR